MVLSTISVVWTALAVATDRTGRPGGGREGAVADGAVVVEAGGTRPASSFQEKLQMASSSASNIIICSSSLARSSPALSLTSK